MNGSQHLIAAFVIAGLFVMPAQAEDDILDFAGDTVPVCEVIDLLASPPEDWFAVPMEGLPSGLAGCQMMRTGPDEELVGILRVSGHRLREGEPGDQSRQRQLQFEVEVLGAMGIVLDIEQPLFSRDNVPLGGSRATGFSEAAQAIGFRALVLETEAPQEVHMLSFHGPDSQYALVLITPPRFVDQDIHQRNTADFARLLGSLDSVSALDD